MSERRRLPNRRDHEVHEFEIGSVNYRASVGRFDDGTVAELFLDAGKVGSGVQVTAHDAAIAVSLALQYGAPAYSLLHAMQKLHDGSPAGPAGVALARATERRS